MDGLPLQFKNKFSKRKLVYRFDEEVAEKPRDYSQDVFIQVFSANLCENCTVNVPIFALLAEKTGIKVRVLEISRQIH